MSTVVARGGEQPKVTALSMCPRKEEKPPFERSARAGGGALGNGFDRALRGQVIDYLDFHLAGWHWPAFNVADIAIVLGAACLVLACFIATRQPQAQEKA